MLKINRIKAVSKTKVGNFGFDYVLKEGLNLISSNKNTRGKSSAMLAIYYCLGFEEIIGGKGKKTLTSVYKTVVEDDNQITHTVLESEAWIEITNGVDVVSIMRSAEMEGRNENLITVYHSSLDCIHDPETYVEDMYVHLANSTTSTKGFHAFLERFIGVELPLVPSSDGAEYKLYMQLLFSVIFIEQKRGWSDLFSAMPVLNIKDAKKRVLEYWLGLDTLSNEKKRAYLKVQETEIVQRWGILVNEILTLCNRENCRIQGLPTKPCILESDFGDKVFITTISNGFTIDAELDGLNKRRKELEFKTPKIIDNFEELQEELEKTETAIGNLENEQKENRSMFLQEKAECARLDKNLQIIDADLRNNKDAQKLKRLGSELGLESYNGRCPICGQEIEDSLLPIQNCEHIMSIEENIRHLEAQKTMISFALEAHRKNINICETNIQSLSSRIFTLRRLAKIIRNDLFAVDESFSETIVYEKINLENSIQALSSLKENIDNRVSEIQKLSDEWAKHLTDKKALPRSNFTERDKEKVDALERNFKNYLQRFNYQSVNSYDGIQISRENYLPISEGFDMKFDSSASDNIRAIWSYTLALLKTSNEKEGNHPQIVMFDEPGQHSIVTNDMVSLFNEIIEMGGTRQVILGITLKDGEIKSAVKRINPEKIHVVDVGNHAFQRLD
ncbi:MAG: hypothetical protein IKC46_10900 [Lachnospiraceae bacterium]|nr:hypothetical protein [Lachnospiraceae bacterium]